MTDTKPQPLTLDELDEMLCAAETGTANSDDVIRLIFALEAERAARLAAEAERDRLLSTPAARDVLAERSRQVEAEGFSSAHDDRYRTGALAKAASCYALQAAENRPQKQSPPSWWPWVSSWWKPTTPRRDLIKAAALILAEIERLDRAALAGQEGGNG